jgi:hypothetical protein
VRWATLLEQKSQHLYYGAPSIEVDTSVTWLSLRSTYAVFITTAVRVARVMLVRAEH